MLIGIAYFLKSFILSRVFIFDFVELKSSKLSINPFFPANFQKFTFSVIKNFIRRHVFKFF